MIKPNSQVYFAECKTIDGAEMGAVKIGLSSSVFDRVEDIGRQLPFYCDLLCSVPGDMFIEYFCHMWLRESHIGGEYFRKSDELMRIVACVRETGSLPFPIVFDGEEGAFISLDMNQYMSKHGITFRDIEKAAGLSTANYQKLLEKQPSGNRRFLAALAVTAVKRGLTVRWARDFKPGKSSQDVLDAREDAA